MLKVDWTVTGSITSFFITASPAILFCQNLDSSSDSRFSGHTVPHSLFLTCALYAVICPYLNSLIKMLCLYYVCPDTSRLSYLRVYLRCCFSPVLFYGILQILFQGVSMKDNFKTFLMLILQYHSNMSCIYV